MIATPDLLQNAEVMLAADQSADTIRFAKMSLVSGLPCSFPEAQAHIDRILEKLKAPQSQSASIEAPVVVAPTVDEPVPEPVSEPQSEPEVSDDEIMQAATNLIGQTEDVQQTVKGLLDQFDITAAEATDFAIKAMQEQFSIAQLESDRLREDAQRWKEVEEQLKKEVDHLYIENYGFRKRKRMKVTPEDEERAAKLLRAQEAKESGPKTRLRTLSYSRKKKLYWLWQDRIPYGAMSTIAGDPDEGKSLITLYIASCVSKGERLYGNTEDTEPGEVLLLSAEDDPEITLRPRLEAIGANLDRIHLLESVMLTDGAGAEGERIAQLDTDIKAIEKILDENPAISLIIIDPISSFLGAANINREQEVRRVLQPLARRARSSGLAVIMVAHFNKNSDTRSAMDRVGGAKAIVGMGRAAWTCVREPKPHGKEGEPMPVIDPDRRLFLKLKGNLAPSKVGGLVYTIRTEGVEVEDKHGRPVMEQQPYILWLEETASTAQEIVIEGQQDRKAPKTDAVVDWLKAYLEQNGGHVAADTIMKVGTKAGHATRTIQRARAKLNLKQGWVGRESHWAFQWIDLQTPPVVIEAKV